MSLFNNNNPKKSFISNLLTPKSTSPYSVGPKLTVSSGLDLSNLPGKTQAPKKPRTPVTHTGIYNTKNGFVQPGKSPVVTQNPSAASTAQPDFSPTPPPSNTSTWGDTTSSAGSQGFDFSQQTSQPQTGTPNTMPSTTELDAARKAYMDALKRETDYSQSMKLGSIDINNKVIPMQDIRGQQQHMAEVAGGQLSGLTNATNVAQQGYQGAQTNYENQLDANKPVALGSGSTLVNPMTGQPIYSNPGSSSSTSFMSSLPQPSGIQNSMQGPGLDPNQMLGAVQSYITRNVSNQDLPFVLGQFQSSLQGQQNPLEFMTAQIESYLPKDQREIYNMNTDVQTNFGMVSDALEQGDFKSSPYRSVVNKVLNTLGKDTPAYNAAVQLFGESTAQKRLALFGASLTSNEQRSAQDFLPQKSDNSNTLKFKIDTLRDMGKMQNERIIMQQIGLPYQKSIDTYLKSRLQQMSTLQSGGSIANTGFSGFQETW